MRQLYYTMHEFDDAKKEADAEIKDCLRDIGSFFPSVKIEIRMAWRKDLGFCEGCMIPTMIPEAELLCNGETIRKDLLDFIVLDVLALETKMIKPGRK